MLKYTIALNRGFPGKPQRPVGLFAALALALVLAPPLGVLAAHAPLILLVVLGPVGWGLMAAGFALALGAATAMYPVMFTAGLGLLLLLRWRAARRPQLHALCGAAVGACAGAMLADWAASGTLAEILLGLGLAVYGAWVGLLIGFFAGMIMAAAAQPRGFSEDPTQVIIDQQPRDP